MEIRKAKLSEIKELKKLVDKTGEMDVIKETFPEAFVISATNCQYKIDDKFYNSLENIDLLYLSIDGYEESYEIARPKATWKLLLEFLDSIDMTRIKKTRLTINYVVTSENYKDIVKLNKLVDEKYPFIEEVRLNIAQNWSEDEMSNLPIEKGMLEELIKYKDNVKGEAPWTYSDCFWPKSGLYMDVLGNIKTCALNTSTLPIGNIFNENVADILNSTRRNEIKECCADNKPNDHCKTCDYKKLSPILEGIFNA